MAITMKDTCWNFTDNREWRAHLGKMPPVIISCAITGGLQGKAANPNIPVAPEEQAQSTYEAYKAGASSVHIHTRDPETNYNTMAFDPESYYTVNKLVREKCPDIIINNTGTPIFGSDDESVMDNFFAVAQPEVASLDVGMLYVYSKIGMPPGAPAPDDVAKAAVAAKGGRYLEDGSIEFEVTTPLGYTKTEKLSRVMKKYGIKQEFEVFNGQSWWFFDSLVKKGMVDETAWCQLVFGMDGCSNQPSMTNAIDMIHHVPSNAMFSMIGVGPLQLPMTTLGILMGGHLRVGMEDNVYYSRGELCESNAQQVERAVRLANDLGREVATPAQAREMLCISATPKEYT
jgi:3-keto-5-aminohexanoate cleavage enzyme